MSVLRLTKAALLSSIFFVPFAFSAMAADPLVLSLEPVEQPDGSLPAVSGVNGKLEFDVGGLSDPASATFRGGASLSVPLGERFGVQGDLFVGSLDGDLSFGGALHAFTRDPASYLLGVTAGVVVADGAQLATLGVEGELYLDRISLEGWAGLASLDYDHPMMADDSGMFAMGDLAYYPTDDWRVSIGATSMLGLESLKLATEYQFSGLGLPLSGTGEFRAYDTGAYSVKVGLKAYFGDEDKSLIDRHRQDDPPNRALDLFSAAGDLLHDNGPRPEDFDTENGCQDAGFYWDWSEELGEFCTYPQ